MIFNFYKKYLKNENGQAAITAVIFLVAIMISVTSGFSSLALKQEKISRINFEGKQSYFLAEGGVEDVIYRITTGRNVSSSEIISLDSGVATTTITDSSGNKLIDAEANNRKSIRKVSVILSFSDSVQFFYGVQVGDGGIILDNNSTISGNVYSTGQIIGSNNNLINGDVISAGANGLIDGINTGASAYANEIKDSSIDADAYYQTITNSTVLGTLYPNSTDPSTNELPISDETIDEWKEAALDGGVITSPCPYEIDDDETIGPIKITCDLEITGSPTITLEGPVWVEGNIIMQNSAVIQISSILPVNSSVVLIADNPSDRIESSRIEIKNLVNFYGSGESNSYILLISQNESAENGGNEIAIKLQNNVEGDLLLYAPHGEILLENNINLKEVTSYRLHIKNLAEVIYETGIGNLLFTSGPSGGYKIQSWMEVE